MIDMNPAKEYFVKVSASSLTDLDRVLNAALESKGINSFYILTEDGISLSSKHKENWMYIERQQSDAIAKMISEDLTRPSKPASELNGFHADIKYDDEDESFVAFICTDMDHVDDEDDDGVFYYYSGGTPQQFLKEFSTPSVEGWICTGVEEIDNGCGCCNDPPCIGCAPPSAPAPVADAVEPIRLHLFSVYTIASDLTESDPVYVMARHEEGAACLFHKARARDHDNIICEVIVSKVQDAEVCDE